MIYGYPHFKKPPCVPVFLWNWMLWQKSNAQSWRLHLVGRLGYRILGQGTADRRPSCHCETLPEVVVHTWHCGHHHWRRGWALDFCWCCQKCQLHSIGIVPKNDGVLKDVRKLLPRFWVAFFWTQGNLLSATSLCRRLMSWWTQMKPQGFFFHVPEDLKKKTQKAAKRVEIWYVFDNFWLCFKFQWIGLRENLNQKALISQLNMGVFLYFFP